jgi:ribosomal protein S21
MANVTRVKVELKKKYNDKEKNFKDMMHAFKRACQDAGILHELKSRQFYETKSEKKRRKRRESENKIRLERLEQKILAGERVQAPSGLVKKILEKIHKPKNGKDKYNKQRR